MSVLKSQRGESPVQYLETAYNLEVYTIRQALKFPKRYTFFITTEIVRLASWRGHMMRSCSRSLVARVEQLFYTLFHTKEGCVCIA